MAVLAQVKEAADSQSSGSFGILGIGSLIVDLRAEGNHFRKIVLCLPSGENPISLVRTRVDPIPSPTIGCEFSPALLYPEWQKHLGLSRAKLSGYVSRGEFNKWKNADLRERLRFIHKPVLDSDFQIGEAVRIPPVRMNIFEWHNNV
jgi:hypothetical protein